MNFIMLLLFILSSIAFFTIMERKLLGIFHLRLGPNKVGMMGLFQPFSDALKLFLKNYSKASKINEMFWHSSPILTILMFLIIINLIPLKSENNMILMNLMMMIMIMSLFIFPLFLGSFFSFSKFSMISSKRLITQMISYEMGLMMLMMVLFMMFMSYNIFNSMMLIKMFPMNMMFLMFMMYILVLSESSRIPFDFIEGESELVSGFNTEYMGAYFSLFFIYEYGMMLFFSIFMSLMMNFLISFLMMYMFILVRSCFPRMRYDQMMILLWKFLYPMLMSLLIMLKFN